MVTSLKNRAQGKSQGELNEMRAAELKNAEILWVQSIEVITTVKIPTLLRLSVLKKCNKCRSLAQPVSCFFQFFGYVFQLFLYS